jgi:hypothetical protein
VAEDSQSGDSPGQGGVFGNLPDTRPGTRSPRRQSGGGGSAPKGKPAAAKAQPERTPPKSAPKPAPAARSAPPPPRPEPAAPTQRGEGGGGIEDLAWAGVAAAAEAATLGVRLASRAFDALRGSAERD